MMMRMAVHTTAAAGLIAVVGMVWTLLAGSGLFGAGV